MDLQWNINIKDRVETYDPPVLSMWVKLNEDTKMTATDLGYCFIDKIEADFDLRVTPQTLAKYDWTRFIDSTTRYGHLASVGMVFGSKDHLSAVFDAQQTILANVTTVDEYAHRLPPEFRYIVGEEENIITVS